MTLLEIQAFVTANQAKIDSYHSLIFGKIQLLADFLGVLFPLSDVHTRYITSVGQSEEQWIGALRSEETEDLPARVDCWLISVSGFEGLDSSQLNIGSFDKPFKITLDYFTDYQQGVDFDDTDPDNIKTNTEHEFIKKLLTLDWLFEQKRKCLGDNAVIENWKYQLVIKRFTSDSTHYAKGDLDLTITDIIL